MTNSTIIFQTAGPFAIKLSLVVQHYKPECPAVKLEYCVQGQGHNEGLKCQWIFVRMISYEPQNILLPNMVWWCCRMSQGVTRNKNCLLSSRSRSQRGLILSKHYSDYYIFWTADSLATKLGPMIGNHRPERLVEKSGLLPSRSRT